MKTFLATKQNVQRNWWIMDADGVVLGRMAARIAPVLMGKTKVTYTPHADMGDFVVVVNADKVKVTGSKAEQREYDYYTLYPGGHRYVSFKEMMARRPEKVVEMAIRRMLPKNKLGRNMLLRLKVYRGAIHKHQAQQPQKLEMAWGT